MAVKPKAPVDKGIPNTPPAGANKSVATKHEKAATIGPVGKGVQNEPIVKDEK